jgi:hypothetical protein
MAVIRFQAHRCRQLPFQGSDNQGTSVLCPEPGNIGLARWSGEYLQTANGLGWWPEAMPASPRQAAVYEFLSQRQGAIYEFVAARCMRQQLAELHPGQALAQESILEPQSPGVHQKTHYCKTAGYFPDNDDVRQMGVLPAAIY